MDSHKNLNLHTTGHLHRHAPPSSSQYLNRNTATNKNLAYFSRVSGGSVNGDGGGVETKRNATTQPPQGEESGRDRLKKHRVDMAGRVWIPDIWGQEDLLKDWIDCTVFDSSLDRITSARTALVQEARSTVVIGKSFI
ncbi:hypothetical protein R6Q57_002796 [Mikania cordata]